MAHVERVRGSKHQVCAAIELAPTVAQFETAPLRNLQQFFFCLHKLVYFLKSSLNYRTPHLLANNYSDGPYPSFVHRVLIVVNCLRNIRGYLDTFKLLLRKKLSRISRDT